MVVYYLSNVATLELLLTQMHVRKEQDDHGASTGGDVLLQAQQKPSLPPEGFLEPALPEDLV